MATQSTKIPSGTVEQDGMQAVCQHHWVIATPNGPASQASCKRCGQSRTFPNSSQDSIWDGTEGRSRWNDMGLARRRRADNEPIAEENVVTV